MTYKVSQRSQDMDTFMVMDMLRRANAYQANLASSSISKGAVCHLEAGEPVATMPPALIKVLESLIHQSIPGYSPSLGLDVLRGRIAQSYCDWEGLDIDWRDIAITSGASGAFVLAFLAAFDPGDRIAMAVPGYPAYRNIVKALGLEPVLIRAGAQHGFHPTVTDLAAAGPLDGVIIASPSNPVGTVIDADLQRALATYCRDHKIRIISDEIYQRIVDEDTPSISMRTYDDQAIIINSFSKYFLMPGWRLGWMVVPSDLISGIEKLAQNLYISCSSLAQRLALEAFDHAPAFDANVRKFNGNRRILQDRLPQAGFDRFIPPQGAFYIYASTRDMGIKSPQLCHNILSQTGVALTPGVDFDPFDGEYNVRFSYAADKETVEQAIDRLVAWNNKD